MAAMLHAMLIQHAVQLSQKIAVYPAYTTAAINVISVEPSLQHKSYCFSRKCHCRQRSARLGPMIYRHTIPLQSKTFIKQVDTQPRYVAGTES